MNFTMSLSVPVNLNKVHLKTTKFFSGNSSARRFSSSSSLIVLQFRNVLVKVQWIRVGESSSLRHLSASNHLFDRHLHLLTTDGVLQRQEEKYCHSWQSWLLQPWVLWQYNLTGLFKDYLIDIYSFLTGMSLVSNSRAGTCLADRAFLMAPLIFTTKSGPKGFPVSIFKNKMTRSSPSVLYWGTQRLSDTSSNASTAERTGHSEGQGEKDAKKMRRADERQGNMRRWEV